MSEVIFSKTGISPSADEALSKSVERVNRGFEGGRVTKSDLASWFILHAAGTLDESGVGEIHKAHFNQVTYLEVLVKKLKASGRENLGPDELATLQAMLGQQTTKKRAKSAQTVTVNSQ